MLSSIMSAASDDESTRNNRIKQTTFKLDKETQTHLYSRLFSQNLPLNVLADTRRTKRGVL